jgi:hypothetical protein
MFIFLFHRGNITRDDMIKFFVLLLLVVLVQSQLPTLGQIISSYTNGKNVTQYAADSNAALDAATADLAALSLFQAYESAVLKYHLSLDDPQNAPVSAIRIYCEQAAKDLQNALVSIQNAEVAKSVILIHAQSLAANLSNPLTEQATTTILMNLNAQLEALVAAENITQQAINALPAAIQYCETVANATQNAIAVGATLAAQHYQIEAYVRAETFENNLRETIKALVPLVVDLHVTNIIRDDVNRLLNFTSVIIHQGADLEVLATILLNAAQGLSGGSAQNVTVNSTTTASKKRFDLQTLVNITATLDISLQAQNVSVGIQESLSIVINDPVQIAKVTAELEAQRANLEAAANATRDAINSAIATLRSSRAALINASANALADLKNKTAAFYLQIAAAETVMIDVLRVDKDLVQAIAQAAEARILNAESQYLSDKVQIDLAIEERNESVGNAELNVWNISAEIRVSSSGSFPTTGVTVPQFTGSSGAPPPTPTPLPLPGPPGNPAPSGPTGPTATDLAYAELNLKTQLLYLDALENVSAIAKANVATWLPILEADLAEWTLRFSEYFQSHSRPIQEINAQLANANLTADLQRRILDVLVSFHPLVVDLRIAKIVAATHNVTFELQVDYNFTIETNAEVFARIYNYSIPILKALLGTDAVVGGQTYIGASTGKKRSGVSSVNQPVTVSNSSDATPSTPTSGSTTSGSTPTSGSPSTSGSPPTSGAPTSSASPTPGSPVVGSSASALGVVSVLLAVLAVAVTLF